MSQTPQTDRQHRTILQGIAQRAMIQRGLLPTFSDAVSAELRNIHAPAAARDATDTAALGIRDLTGFVWASIDNDDSRDLDQLTVAEALAGGDVKIRVAVADVDALVKEARPSTPTPVTTRPRSTPRPRLPDAPREAVHRPHVAEPRRGPHRRGRGNRGRRGRRDRAFGHLPGACPESRQARLQQRRRLARRRDGCPRPWPRSLASRRTSALRTGCPVAGPAPRARRAEPGDHQGEAGLRRRRSAASTWSGRTAPPRSSRTS